MTYNPNIPGPNDLLSQSQSDIQQNFLVLNQVMDINHYPFTDLSGEQGKHRFLQMPIIPNPPGPVPPNIGAEETALYSKVSGDTQLFFTSDGNNREYQMTRAIDASFALFSENVNNYNGVGATYTGGWTYLPGGLLYQYGLVTSLPAAGTKTVTFPVAFTTACYAVTLNGITSAKPEEQCIINANATTTNFVINNRSSTFTRAYWTAVGK